MHFPRVRPTLPARTLWGLVVAAFLATNLALGSPDVAHAATRTAVQTSLRTSLQTWINRDRAAAGLRPLRLDVRLNQLAGERADWMAAHGQLSHRTVDGSVSEAYTARTITWYLAGENVGYTTSPWGLAAASSIYVMWRDSPTHWAQLMSADYNYVGIGLTYAASSGATYASIALLEGPDRTAPVARMRTKSVLGTTIAFSWSGVDPLLQTHTAGLRDFNVQYRVDDLYWVQIRSATRATALVLRGRAHSHWYAIRIQARDWRANLSPWSTALRVWVP